LIKKIVISIAAFCIGTTIMTRREVFGRSFMFTRPASASVTMREQAWHLIKYRAKDSLSGIYGIVYGEHSRHVDKCDKYFLFNNKRTLLVAGDMAAPDLTRARDIRAEWLQLPDDFSGSLRMRPTQRQYGFLLGYHQPLCTVTDISFLQDSWFDFQLPFAWVQNDLHLTQQDINNPGTTFPRDILEAFNNPAWRFAKISGKRSRFGIANLRIEFGKTYLAQDFFEIAYYSFLVLPLSGLPDPEHFFDPVVDYNSHAGFGGGVHMQIPLTRCDYMAHSLFMNLESVYLFHRKQKRTFDLKDAMSGRAKPWSRFMLFNVQKGPPNQNIPGVNLLTREVTAHLYGVVDFCVGYRLTHEMVEFEIGYGIWGHSDEKLRFKEPSFTLFEPFGIAGANNDPNNPTTSSNSTISTLQPNNSVFTPITLFDIDRCSAAAPSAFMQRIHVAVACAGTDDKCQRLNASIGIGGFVELPNSNSPLPMWGGWVNAGVVF